ncbi:hypothetical protein [uncultured Bradyrhizobium sp.]|uniref:hypothetical protein n=1 Tax=uncultured Bradyrhizobium sp. TaxID=199684 RepID=UPI002622813E|nr:hypothetical protein [uncultured Bradyrhizobium sp.]
MYKLIFAFLCGFFAYGVANRVLPAPASAQVATAADAHGAALAAPQLNASHVMDGASGHLPVYVPSQDDDATCESAGRTCAWSI